MINKSISLKYEPSSEQFTSQQQMDAKKCVQMCQKRFRKDGLATVTPNNYLTEMCSSSEAGSHLRRIDFVYDSPLGLRVIAKKRFHPPNPGSEHRWDRTRNIPTS